MTSVWVVEQGSYSDYSVLGVFSTEEGARLVADKINTVKLRYQDEATVAEWPLDPLVEELRAGRDCFSIIMERDGTCSVNKPGWLFGAGDRLELGRSNWDSKGLRVALWGNCWATDEAHAAKIANERRTELIASGEWDRYKHAP